MRPDGSLRPADLSSVLRLILTIPYFLCNQTTSGGVLVRLQPVPHARFVANALAPESDRHSVAVVASCRKSLFGCRCQVWRV